MAIKRGACHLAGSHLLDTADGTYNVSYIRKYLPGRAVKLVNLVLPGQRADRAARQPQGHSRNRGPRRGRMWPSSTARAARAPGSCWTTASSSSGSTRPAITGYGAEEFTHMSVAVAVLSGSADAGLGIFAAAKALDLDFIPVVTETVRPRHPGRALRHGEHPHPARHHRLGGIQATGARPWGATARSNTGADVEVRLTCRGTA
ncbi:MAG: hypothetical protein MZV70_02985 [Desulfobacterales bacterium]|nr:hypothetical protein [Desulfobacterales bacterium]